MPEPGEQKSSEQLENRLRECKPGDVIDVVLEVAGEAVNPDPSKPRSQRMQILRSAFDDESAGVRKLVETVGGEVLGDSWLSRALQARVPVERVRDLMKSLDVRLVDVPRQIDRS